uniref:Uncharacterized protein n=1 Tax=Zooxanthella nutricula TaxID=1333877 RepID=A0A7S2ISH8_9DINO
MTTHRQSKQSQEQDKDAEVAGAEAAGAEAAGRPPPSAWRALALVLIGFGPLANCVVLGEGSHSVLVAMVSMHWGAMLVPPMLFYLVRSCQGHGYAALRLYTQACSEVRADAVAKALRGTALGVPTFLLFGVGYLSMRCRTLVWPLCIVNFQDPLEDYGFEVHAMLFRVFAGVYFTFWNPVIEELFWRVFLHRELGDALGIDEKEEAALISRDDATAPWRSLLRGALGALPGRGVPLRWGVSALYASYHVWPITIVFVRVTWMYAVGGFLFLMTLGRFFVLLREHRSFGLMAAYVLHVWVDAAFAVLCLFEVHPLEFFA